MRGTGIHSYQGAVLPVELTKLSAEVESNNLATISWTTATEKNSDYFIVEKLDDFEQWYTIAEVSAAGFSDTEISY